MAGVCFSHRARSHNPALSWTFIPCNISLSSAALTRLPSGPNAFYNWIQSLCFTAHDPLFLTAHTYPDPFWFCKTLDYWASSGVIQSEKSNGTRNLWHIYSIFIPTKCIFIPTKYIFLRYTRIWAAQIAISCDHFPSLNFLVCVCHQIS